ncbi:type II secretion system F family protein [Nocardioides perillae]|uniref:Tight adherence protein B n=1 Tax=Nocardioides perillae TaxID=1119534 RepID=A0A7Y9UUV9_9ACTN|nr:type II secretion system F family protein [Nocardioides perillae]NYG53985.1 tight adherence protein B [Nocardioides perillae]
MTPADLLLAGLLSADPLPVGAGAEGGWVAVAVVAAAASVALLVRPRPTAAPARGGPGVRPRGDGSGGEGRWAALAGRARHAPVAVGLVGGGAAAVLVSVPGPGGAAVVLLAVAAAAAGLLLGRARRRRGARAVAARVQEVCDLLSSDLAAGLPPGSALTRAAADWSVLAPVARAAELGGDVPQALRRVAERPGAAGLARLAAAWEVSLRTGQGLAGPVARTATAVRRARATARVVDSELASARATARLLATLPVLALLLGGGAGGEPWRFLLATTPGLVCLGLGLAAALLGTAWIERIADGVEVAP